MRAPKSGELRGVDIVVRIMREGRRVKTRIGIDDPSIAFCQVIPPAMVRSGANENVFPEKSKPSGSEAAYAGFPAQSVNPEKFSNYVRHRS